MRNEKLLPTGFADLIRVIMNDRVPILLSKIWEFVWMAVPVRFPVKPLQHNAIIIEARLPKCLGRNDC